MNAGQQQALGEGQENGTDSSGDAKVTSSGQDLTSAAAIHDNRSDTTNPPGTGVKVHLICLASFGHFLPTPRPK